MTTTNKQHVHHDMIVAWAKDPSRKLQLRLDKAHHWVDLSTHPAWIPSMLYRFKPESVVIKYREYIYVINGKYQLGIVSEGWDIKCIEGLDSFVEWRGGWKTLSFDPCHQE